MLTIDGDVSEPTTTDPDALADKLARAKGLFESADKPGRQLLFQLAGGRATLAPYDLDWHAKNVGDDLRPGR